MNVLAELCINTKVSKSWQQMNQAEQTMLRYNYLLSITSDAQGDFARNSHTWANQTKILSQQWEMPKARWSGIYKCSNAIVKLLNALVQKNTSSRIF